MKYSIDKIMNKTLLIEGKKTLPLRWLQSMNNLHVMTIEEYLEKYNQDYKNFSLRELVNKLEANCIIYNKTTPHGEPQVSDSYIYEKISRHFTEFKKGTTKKRPEDRKYDIYLAVDTRDIPDYASEQNLKVIRNANSARKKKLIQRYTYKNPLNRIHGFLITDDTPCLCKSSKKKYLSIVIICANPHASNANIKAVGSYLLMFSMIKAYEYKFHKIILEVTNSENDIKGALEEDSDEEEEDSDEEEEDSDEEEEDSDEEEEDSDEEEEDSDEEEEDSDDEEDSDEEEDSDDEEETRCCDTKIKRNILCNKDEEEYEQDDSTDKYPYKDRMIELEKYETDDLYELIQCYDVDYYADINVSEAKKILNYYGIRNLPKGKKKIIDLLERFENNNDHLLKERIIKAILKFEYWNFDEYDDLYEGEKCSSDWNIGNLDPDIHGYHGTNYKKGKQSTKDLYCKFYEKHGFIEDFMLNLKEKCFSADPLPSMYIDTKENTLENLIRVFIERKFYQEPSDFCKSTGLEIPPEKLVIH